MADTQNLGFIGVGDLAEYTIKGLRRGGYQGRILLSPRNQDMSQKLAADWQCEVMESNQAVVDACDQFILSARPAHCLDALASLKLRPNHLLISVVAGVSIEKLREQISDLNIDIIRAMPVNSAQAGASPTLIFPHHPAVGELFNYCGNSIIADSEAAFDQGSIIACVYTWYFELFNELIQATSSEFLSTELASELVLGMAKGAASLALQDKARSPGEIAEAIATDGTFSKFGLDLLKEHDAFEPWQKACQLLSDKLNQTSDAE